jgi:soluble lytic murein transglycosylase-like protein
MSKIKYCISGLLATIALLGMVSAHGASIYVYVSNSGNRLITDHPRPDLKGYKLLKKYGIDENGDSAVRRTNNFLRPVKSNFNELIFSQADKIGLEPALLKAMVHVESAFNPNAVSPKGAKGLMQLMPATAKRFGVIERGDPVASLEGGGQYMRYLLSLFNQDTRLALAAYNAGENAVAKYNGIPPYPETQDYVERVIELRNKYRKNLIGA